jgi:hypothetical protein
MHLTKSVFRRTAFNFSGFSLLAIALLSLPSARADILATCPDCDGDRFAITYHLESDNGTLSIYNVTLLADTSGNNLGAGHHIDAVAIGLNKVTVESAMDFAPNGAANWTAQGGGLSAGGCNGHGAFICASANSSAFAALAPNASTATTPYEWTWDVDVLDSTPGGAASVFSTGGVKIHYSDLQGHLVSDDFTFTDAPPPSDQGPAPTTVPETSSVLLLGTVSGLIALVRRFRVA